MTTVLDTNAPALRDAHGDFAGYDLPECDPVSINTTWVRKWGRDDELQWFVTWADGTTATMFTLPNKWGHIKLDTQSKVVAGSNANLAGVDAALRKRVA